MLGRRGKISPKRGIMRAPVHPASGLLEMLLAAISPFAERKILSAAGLANHS
jgi:hypothetical protein